MDRRIKMKQQRRNAAKASKKRAEAKMHEKRAAEASAQPPVEDKKKKAAAAPAAAEAAAAAVATAKPAAAAATAGTEEKDEDQFEDEIIEEDFVTPEEAEERDRRAEAGEDVDDLGMGELQSALSVWDPTTQPLKKGEELTYEPRAYDMLHRMSADWPALSFDVLRDSLGMQRKRFPHTMLFAAGTQADIDARNKITLMRASLLCKTKHDRDDSEDEDSDGEDSNSDSDDDLDEDPVLETSDIHHHGTVNRLRSNPVYPYLLASWSSTGKVNVFDIKAWYTAMDCVPEAAAARACGEDEDEQDSKKPGFGEVVADVPKKPLHSFKHKCEGFALDWNPHRDSTTRLLTGDCSGAIYLWHGCELEPVRGKSVVTPQGPFRGHLASVEDLQWSPTEPTIFASCSSDRSIRIWDARVPGSAGAVATATNVVRVCESAHSNDVNVISWNRLQTFLLASGSDDGSFRVWDLRNFQDATPVSDFRYHTKPITSIEWSPYDESTLAVASEDNTITIWDLSLEADTDEQADEAAAGADAAAPPLDVPPQLMFVHMGQTDIKELHWHPQIMNTLLSTALDGFNVLKPANL